jgi:hypothetical protein
LDGEPTKYGMKNKSMLTYLHLKDIDNPADMEVYRLLDQELSVGLIIEKSVNEGHVPYEVISYKQISVVFENRGLFEVMIKKHPFVQTYCRHEWSTELTKRSCTKCKSIQRFNCALAKWEDEQ